MAGPSITLAVNASGKDTLEGLNTALDRLRGNLGTFKSAKPDLSGLEDLTAQFQRFQAGFKELMAGQKTSLAELAEILKVGFAGAVGATRSGAKALAEEVKTAEQQQAQAFASLSRQMQKQAEDMSKASAKVVNNLVKQAGKGEAGTQTLLYGKGAGTQAELAAMASYYREIEEAEKRGVGELEKAQAVAVIKLEKSTAAVIKAATQPGYQAAGPAWWDKVLEKQETAQAKLEAENAAAIIKLEKSTAAVIKAATQPGYQAAGPAWWDKVLKEEEAALLKMQKLDAAFAARSLKGQSGTAVAARSQLDTGISEADVIGQYGKLATEAAKAGQSLEALRLTHEKTAPAVRGLTGAVQDLHGGLRGLAAGFGQTLPMFASIGTFLAGTALAGAFTQTIKMGSEVAHILEVIGSLGGNTAAEVQAVKSSLLELGANGPFGPLEIAGAFKTLSLAGLDAKQQVAAIKDVLNFSIASGGGLNLDESAKSLVAIGTAFGYTADGFGRVGDVISKAAAISMSDVSDFTAAMRTGSVVSTLYGVSLESLGTQVAELAQIGIRGTSAGTAIRNFYDQITKSNERVTSTLKQLGVSVRYETGDLKGQVKDYVQLIGELNTAMKKYDAAGQTAIIQTLSNNRGSKDLVTGLEAYRKAAAEKGPDDKALQSQLESFKRQITESYGFMGIAAANLAVTAKNQMLSVVAALQTSLVSAFDSVEPTVIVISARLREAFSSEEFRAAIRNLATSVGNLTVFLVDHAQAIKVAVEAWLAYKVVLFGFTAFSQIALVVGSIATAVRGLASAQLAAGAASAAAPALGLAAVGPTAAVAAGGLARLLGLLGPIGALLGVAASLWLTFGNNAVKASTTAAEASVLGTNDIIKSLEDQSAALMKKNALLATGMTLQQASLVSDQEMAKEKLKLQREDERRVKEAKVASAQAEYTRLETLWRSIGSTQLPSAYPLDNARKDLAEFDSVTAKLSDKLNGAITKFQALSKTNAEIINTQLKAAKQPAGDQTFKLDKPEKPESQLASLRSEFASREKTLKEGFAAEQATLNERHKEKLLGDTLYSVESLDIADRQYTAELALLKEYTEKAQPYLAKARTEGKRPSKADATDTELKEALARLDLELKKQKELAAIRSEGAANLEGRKDDTKLAALREAVDLQERQLTNKLAYDSKLPEEQAYDTAKNAQAEKYYALTESTLQLIKDAQRDLSKLDENSPVAATLNKEITRLKSELKVITDARDVQSDRAGAIAAKGVEPAWKKNLAEWSNSTRSMQRYWDEMVEGTIEKGKGIWDTFVKTGKVSFSSLVDFVRDEMSKAVYEQTIAPYVASLGKSIANKTLGERPGQSKEGRAGAETAGPDWATVMREKALTVWDSVKNAASPLLDTFKNFGSGLGNLIQQLISWGTSLLSGNAAGSTGGLAGLVGGLFGESGGGLPGGGSSGVPDAFTSDLSGFFAGGFAKGDVFGSPTHFRFANGAGGFNTGLLGEAGPEAVMPLKRGVGGALGVVNHAAAASPSVKVIINAPPGVEVRQEERQGADGKELELWLSMAEKRSVAAVNKSIATGAGSTASALKARGVSLNGNLPRRD